MLEPDPWNLLSSLSSLSLSFFSLDLVHLVRLSLSSFNSLILSLIQNSRLVHIITSLSHTQTLILNRALAFLASLISLSLLFFSLDLVQY